MATSPEISRRRRAARFARRLWHYGVEVMLAGLPAASWIVRAGLLVFGFGLLAVVGLVAKLDPLVVVTAAVLVICLIYVVGAFRLWDAAERSAAHVAASPDRPQGVSADLRLRQALKQGRNLRDELVDPIVGKVACQGIGPWTQQVVGLIHEINPAAAAAFVDSDSGVPPWNPMLVSLTKHRDVMDSRLAWIEAFLNERSF